MNQVAVRHSAVWEFSYCIRISHIFCI